MAMIGFSYVGCAAQRADHDALTFRGRLADTLRSVVSARVVDGAAREG
jgi:hypothetical protein